jgi:Transcriptional regulator PadR-like family
LIGIFHEHDEAGHALTKIPVLTALAAGPQHGYGITTDVARISGNRVRLRAGTLYAALDRLRGEQLIDADRDEIVTGDSARCCPRSRSTTCGTSRRATRRGWATSTRRRWRWRCLR